MRVIPRAEWGAKPAKSAVANIGPRSLVFRHHSATSPGADEAAHMRYIQQIAFGRGFIDISYSFVIFNSGNIYEGRGWGKLGAHTKGYNDDAWGVTFAGNFNNMTLSDSAVNAYRWLISEGKRLGWIPSGPTHREHDEVSATACPGDSVEARRGALDTPWDGSGGATPPPPPPPPVHQHSTNDVRFRKQSDGRMRAEVWHPEANRWFIQGSDPWWEVRDIQQHLANKGFSPGAIDGLGGPNTQAAVWKFQQANGFTTDSWVGPRTWARLHS